MKIRGRWAPLLAFCLCLAEFVCEAGAFLRTAASATVSAGAGRRLEIAEGIARESINALFDEKESSGRHHHKKHRHHRLREAERQISKLMSVQAAAKNLARHIDSLPRSVAMLVKNAAHMSKLSTDPADVARSLQILNEMVLETQKRLDGKIIECNQSQESFSQRYNQIEGDLARLADRIADLKGQRTAAIAGVQQADEEIAELKARWAEELRRHGEVTAEYQRDRTLRQSDLDDALFVTTLTQCQGSAAAGASLLSLHKRSNASVHHRHKRHSRFSVRRIIGKHTHDIGWRLCRSTGNGGFYLHNNQHELRAIGKGHFSAHRQHLLQRLVSTYSRAHEEPVTTTAAPGADDTVADPNMHVGDPLRPEQSNKCVLDDMECPQMHAKSVEILGEMQDAVDELDMRASHAEQVHQKLIQDLSLEIQLLTEGKHEYDLQLAGSTAQMNGQEGEKEDVLHEAHMIYAEQTFNAEQCKREIHEILVTDLCSLKTLRASVLQQDATGSITPSDVVDCEVSDWIAGACSKNCDDTCNEGVNPGSCGGTRNFQRYVIQPPNEHGAQCPPLESMTACNQVRCPVDCVMSMWSGWSACSKECDGGIRQRTRNVLTQPRNEGTDCDAVTETESCNTGACDVDCTLSDWTEWSGCSSACNAGYKERVKHVVQPTRGANGKCAAKWNEERYESAPCNEEECEGDEVCMAKQDLIIAVDGSGALNSDSFAAIRSFVSSLVQRYRSTAYGESAMRIGVIQFGNGAMLADEGITAALQVTGLSADLDAVKAAVDGMQVQTGFPNVAQALALANKMYTGTGRHDANYVVMLITASVAPFKISSTQMVQKLWDNGIDTVSVSISRWAESEEAKAAMDYASHPAAGHYFHIPGIAELNRNLADYVVKVMVKECPKAESPSLVAQADTSNGFRLIAAGQACGDSSTHTLLSKVAETVQDCADLATEQGASFFSYGTSYRRGYCWSVDTSAESCPEGLRKSYSKFFALSSR